MVLIATIVLVNDALEVFQVLTYGATVLVVAYWLLVAAALLLLEPLRTCAL